MEFLQEIGVFYQSNTFVKVFEALSLPMLPLILLVMSLVENYKLTRKKVVDGHSWRSYHSRRIPVTIAYVICDVVLGILGHPIRFADSETSPIPLLIGVIVALLYLYGVYCLVWLEAGTAALMYICIGHLPVMGVFYEQLDAAMWNVIGLGIFVVLCLLSFACWTLLGSKCAQECLGVRSVWNLKDEGKAA